MTNVTFGIEFSWSQLIRYCGREKAIEKIRCKMEGREERERGERDRGRKKEKRKRSRKCFQFRERKARSYTTTNYYKETPRLTSSFSALPPRFSQRVFTSFGGPTSKEVPVSAMP